MKRIFLILGIVFLTYTFAKSQDLAVNIIPEPQKVEILKGTYIFAKKIKIVIPFGGDEYRFIADLLKEKLASSTDDIQIIIDSDFKRKADIVFILTNKYDPKISKEGYYLTVKKNVEIVANSAQGLFYGLQTLLQLMSPEELSETVIPKVKIADKPRFEYRGMHLDVCRHFVTVDSVKRYIDLLAMHKMNTFHWHLTEDQGWRIEIKKYPLLTQIGSKRRETMVAKNFNPFVGDGKSYSGFYTQEEIKDIVKYAQLRQITIIPEIEMPGHSLAALAAYPFLGCTGKDYSVGTKWGVFNDVYCAGNDSVFVFLQNVLTEVMELFPSKYIHIGGDECPKTHWSTCPKCQLRIINEGLENEHELQSYFIKRIETFLNAHGRSIIGWDEILEGGLAPNATVMSWRGEKGGVEAARQKHNVIMTPGGYCYFDHYQANPKTEPLAIGGYTNLKTVYFYEPIPKGLTPSEAKYVLGAQGNVWTEYMPNYKHVEYMAVPRICALSEVLWSTKESRDWDDFLVRLEILFKRLDKLDVNYCKNYLDEKE
ncbi:MAG: beta-N-acetylhexosaminidase [Bacteroidota bacterium]|nr:beta-N-acetylhexosaminidase [Bacteroidota bacterium]